ncbi:MAG: hypothetical protein J6B75_03250 [Ruminococcus sp.]|nr:hypothetical protein [Ruminococcus sp.]
MTTEMRNLLITLGAIIIVLLLVMILFGGKSPIMKIFNFFLEDTGEGGRQPKEDVQKSSFEPIVEMAKLVRKSDDRLRIYESDGSFRLVDAYYELEFITRKGKKLKIECSKEAYEKIPFNEEGSLTYKRNTLVKFKFYEGTVFNSTEQK